MKWPWSRPEVRESFTEQVINNMMNMASGSSDASLAAIEISSRWWGSSLSTASISPVNAALAPVNASFLDFVGVNWCDAGNPVIRSMSLMGWWSCTRRAAGRWKALIVVGIDLYLQHERPQFNRDRKLEASQVIHIRYGSLQRPTLEGQLSRFDGCGHTSSWEQAGTISRRGTGAAYTADASSTTKPE